ncbi:4'-phosphopantetheinyl transferase family protein [Collimonas sp.]|jgi:enterobactin synthetase component D|uniref:4'-phosphopantetheinyl transferase family protein n=1 Tax=Collimonas sp. TaxID=1963772 RepID=UPI002C277F8D|nr:4'-phosphopantetheinyl transferase superfamily protein [Collimonas sp.]HWX03622.1 4'-phosphopantetheinyl transferase superfamily protein [Collimonas sp.]
MPFSVDPMTASLLPQLPDSVSQAGLRYVVDAAQLASLKAAGIVLPASLANAVLKRQVEFAAGRLCARLALHQQGYGGSETLAIGEHRAPLWPPGYIGSISHGDGQAVAVVAVNGAWRALGIDIESMLSREAAQPLVAHLMDAAEQAIGDAAGLPLERWLGLVFSAKESLFKALYPFVGRYFDFLDVEVCELDETQGSLMLRLLGSLSPQCVKGSEYCIRYRYSNNNIATLCLF